VGKKQNGDATDGSRRAPAGFAAAATALRPGAATLLSLPALLRAGGASRERQSVSAPAPSSSSQPFQPPPAWSGGRGRLAAAAVPLW
jgi:hypothetical protein